MGNNNAFLGIYQGKKLLKLEIKVDINVPVATNQTTLLTVYENKWEITKAKKLGNCTYKS